MVKIDKKRVNRNLGGMQGISGQARFPRAIVPEKPAKPVVTGPCQPFAVGSRRPQRPRRLPILTGPTKLQPLCPTPPLAGLGRTNPAPSSRPEPQVRSPPAFPSRRVVEADGRSDNFRDRATPGRPRQVSL